MFSRDLLAATRKFSFESNRNHLRIIEMPDEIFIQFFCLGGEMLPGNPARIPSDVGANPPEALHSHRSGHAALPLQVISKKYTK
jgi:hypothetical protein